MTEEKYPELRVTAKTPEEAFRRLMNVIELLRKECPWDKEQDHKSLRVCMLEEAYEVADAIDNDDMDNLKEELGDVLLQVVFHTSLASEADNFAMTDVINDECEKMIRRHPHIFSQESAKTVDKVLEKWENVKRGEKGETTQLQRLKSVPRALPALTRGYKVQKRAADVGFDWDDVSGAFDKLREETTELIDAYGSSDRAAITEEVGDLLFSVVNVARFLDVDPEYALTQTSDKFIRRFGYIEEQAASMGLKPENMTLAEMDALWNEAKELERAGAKK